MAQGITSIRISRQKMPRRPRKNLGMSLVLGGADMWKVPSLGHFLRRKHQVPRAQITSIFEVQPSKTSLFPSKQVQTFLFLQPKKAPQHFKRCERRPRRAVNHWNLIMVVSQRESPFPG